MKHFKPVSFILTLIFFLCLVVSSVAAATEDELNQQKSDATTKKDAAQYQVDTTQNTISGIQSEIDKSNAQIASLTQKINDLNATIDKLNGDLDTAQSELAAAEAKRDQQQKELEERLRVMYMYGNEGYIEVLFSATNFGDLVEKADNMQSIAQADKESADQLKKTEEEIEQKKQNIENNKAQVEAAKEQQNQALADQESIKSQQNQLLANNQSILSQYQAEVDQQNAEIKSAEDGLAAIAAQKAAELEAQRQAQAAAEEAQRQAEAAASGSSSSSDSSDSGSSSSASSSSSSVSSSGYIWPSDYYEITDYFGYRESPGGIGSTNHMGLDIGASYGSPIYAVASGTVVLAEYYGGYGNCVEISHDSGYTTLYGHQSAIAVSEGQYVNQGDVIGYVGSTGNSTGAHLHISFIDSSGTFEDPLNFLPY
jgi:septal ring factor EnvC (AmiA/AmiB activator)